MKNIAIALFCRERNREMEIWNGYRAGIDGAIEIYDADEAYAIDLLDEEIIDKLLNKQRLYYRIGKMRNLMHVSANGFKRQMHNNVVVALHPLKWFS